MQHSPHTIFSEPDSIPSYGTSLNGPSPNHRALVIGMNYESSQHELKGGVDDAKEFKTLLQGRAQPPLHDFLIP